MSVRNLIFAALSAPLLLASINATSAASIITFDVPGAKQTYAGDIDNQGNVIGSYDDSLGLEHGYIRFADGTLQFYSGKFDALPISISSNGAITGYVSKGRGRAFVGSLDGTVKTFRAGKLDDLFGNDINNAGAIVGYDHDFSGVYHSFLRAADGRVKTFDAPGAGTTNGEGTQAGVISEDGIICGEAITNDAIHGFVRDKKGNILVFDPPGARTTSVSAIGRDGTIAGSYVDAGSVSHAFLRSTDGNFSTFDAPGAGNQDRQGTWLSDTNKKGATVGFIIGSNFVSRGYIRNTKGRFTFFDAPGAGTVSDAGTVAYQENDKNEIVGVYYDNNLQAHGFIRLP